MEFYKREKIPESGWFKVYCNGYFGWGREREREGEGERRREEQEWG